MKEQNRYPAHCKYWNEGQALAFLNHEYNSTQLVMPSATEYMPDSEIMAEFWQNAKLASLKAGNVSVVNRFDAAVLRLPHGWLGVSYMNNVNRIIETIETTHRTLGATTIIIPTVPMFNNVKSESDCKQVAQINSLIREVARNITESEGDVCCACSRVWESHESSTNGEREESRSH